MIEDVSDGGAKLTVEGSIEGLQLKEFFLLLSSTGLAYRRCGLAQRVGQRAEQASPASKEMISEIADMHLLQRRTRIDWR
jgi:hypothetical protein